jgi:Kef-type K+ transport system membrane component KefB
MIAKKKDTECVLESPKEKKVADIVSACFMVFVGLSMPAIFGAVAPAANTAAATASKLDWGTIGVHVIIITVLSNLGKMFPALCYRREADWRERLAIAVTMFPRGEVGAGVLVISLSYGIGGPMIIVAMCSLVLNLLLTGVFILIVRRLISGVAEKPGIVHKSSL